MPKDTIITQCDRKSQKCYPPPAKVIKISETMEILEAKGSITNDVWVTYNRNTLRHSDKTIIENGSQLTDSILE